MIPKARHAKPDEKVAGYLNAAQTSLEIALRLSIKDRRTANRIAALSKKIEELKESLG